MMRFFFILITLSFSCQSDELATLEKLKEITEERLVTLAKNDGRQNEIADEARRLGYQMGQYDGSKLLNEFYVSRASIFDKGLDFKRLGLVQRYKDVYLIYPTIYENQKKIFISKDKQSFRVRDKSYYFGKEAYFSINEPSWRDYLLMSLTAPKIDSSINAPRDESEQRIWVKNLNESYKQGLLDIEKKALINQQRLAKDIIGMIRFDILRDRGGVSKFEINDAYIPVSGGGFELDIRTSSVEIVLNPQLNSDSWNWKSLPQLYDSDGLLPDNITSKFWITK